MYLGLIVTLTVQYECSFLASNKFVCRLKLIHKYLTVVYIPLKNVKEFS